MASQAPATPLPQIDSNEALHLAIVEGDSSFLTPAMQQRVENWFLRIAEEAEASGPARPFDLERFKREARARFQAKRQA